MSLYYICCTFCEMSSVKIQNVYIWTVTVNKMSFFEKSILTVKGNCLNNSFMSKNSSNIHIGDN